MKDELKIKEAAAELMKDTSQRQAFAEMIVEYIEPQHIAVDMIGLLLNTRNLKAGDSIVKKIRKGIRVWTHTPGAKAMKSEVTVSDRINYILDTAQVSVHFNEWDLESGDIGTVESIKREAEAKLRDYYFGKVFTALTSIWTPTNTPSNYTSVSSAITATALDNAIDRINQTTSGAKAIVGTRAALTPITKFGAFWSDGTNYEGVPSQLEEVMKTGWLGKYYGTPIVALRQQWDNPEDYNALLPNDKVLVIGENVGEFITYGDTRTVQYTDPTVLPPQLTISMWNQFGLMVDNAQGLYVIKIV